MVRKSFLVFIVTFILSGCIREDINECDVYINLTFHHLNSTAQFDEIIGNDVYVYLYKDDYLCQSLQIPYEEIREGRKFRIRKTFDGGFNITAWAVPKGKNEVIIPTTEEHSNFSTSVIGHKAHMRDNLPHFSPLDDLFLGVIKETTGNVLPEADYIVAMKNTICKVNVIVDPVLFGESSVHGDPNIHLQGSARGETLDMESYGDEVCVKTNLDRKTSDEMMTTNVIGLMPSYKNKTLTLTAYSGNVKVFSVETGELSEPGKEITIIIKGLTAEIKVNGWRVKTTSIIFN